MDRATVKMAKTKYLAKKLRIRIPHFGVVVLSLVCSRVIWRAEVLFARCSLAWFH